MLTFEPLLLPEGQAAQLREWLRQPQREMLERVAQGKAQSHLVKYANEAMSASSGDHKLEGATVELKRARKYMAFIETLNELASQREPYAYSKIS